MSGQESGAQAQPPAGDEPSGRHPQSPGPDETSRISRLPVGPLAGLVAVLAVVVVGALILVLRPDPATGPRPVPSAAGEQLTWAPPDTDGYTEKVVTSAGTIKLDDDTDYVIRTPETLTGPVTLKGGRNVVWIGGHISIADQGEAASSIGRRALVVVDGPQAVEDRIVHIEGMLIDGEDLSEGIDTNAPTAILQLANIRIGKISFRSAADRDGDAPFSGGNHPDLVQLWGSVGELRVDRFTGTSSYQGFFFKVDQNAPSGPIRIRRTNIIGVAHRGRDGQTYVPERLLYWEKDSTGPMFFDEGTCWIQPAAQDPDAAEHGIGSEVYYPQDYRDSDGESQLAAHVQRDDTGTYASWAQAVTESQGQPAVRNLAGDGPGKVYEGLPPGGDYVPAGSVGADYENTVGYAVDVEGKDS